MEKTHDRIDLACEQLDCALELFLSQRSYVSALTLAGASEEILGKALGQIGSETTLEATFHLVEPTQTLISGRSYTSKEYRDEKNRVRNAVKHMRDSSVRTIDADLEDEALWMIVRACDNYQRLNFPETKRMAEFEEWFHKNILGIEAYDV